MERKQRASFVIGSTRTLRRSDSASNSPTVASPLSEKNRLNTWTSIDFEEFSISDLNNSNTVNISPSSSGYSLESKENGVEKVVIQSKGLEQQKGDKLLRQKKNEKFECILNYENYHIEYHASCEVSVQEVKVDILKNLERLLQGKGAEENVFNTNEYLLKVIGVEEYIEKDKQQLPLRRLEFIQICSKSYITPRFEMVRIHAVKELDEEARKNRNLQELSLGNSIANLIGPELLQSFLGYENEEIADFRRSSIKIKLEEEKSKLKKLQLLEMESSVISDKRVKLLPEYLHNEPMPLIVPESILINVYLPGVEEMFVRLSVSPLITSEVLLNKVFNKYTRTIGERASGKVMEEYVIKVTGYQEYFYGQNQLIGYDYIRKCVSNSDDIILSLIELVTIEDLLSSLSSTYHSLVDDLIVLEPEKKDEDNPNQLIQIVTITDPFLIHINSIERAIGNSEVQDTCYLYVLVELYHAGHKLGEGFTSGVKACSDPQWNETIKFENVEYCQISLGTKVLFTIFKRNYDPSYSGAWNKSVEKNDEAIAWVGAQIFDYSKKLKCSPANYRMWLGARANPIGSCAQNLLQLNTPILFVDYLGKKDGKRMYYPTFEPAVYNPNLSTSEETKAKIDAIIRADPLYELTPEDKLLLWGNRYYISSIPSALSKFLLTVNWSDPMQVREAHRTLPIWAKPSPLVALELLDAKFADPTIRDYGVSCLQYMPDGECFDFMLQLTQVLKHEPYHNSALAMFLLKRAWNNRNIGNSFYWFLKAELHLEDLSERYTLLLESYVRGDERILKELVKQQEVNNQLISSALKIKNTPKEDRKRVLLESLEKIKFPSSFQLALNQKMEVKDLIVPKCKHMDSKKLPLWLVWNSTEALAKPILVIFKVGDDLRQDVLTLQILRIFDKLWKNEGLDLLLKPYGCIATGDEIGMIEVVKDAETTANINKAAGGTAAVLKENVLTKWLKKNNHSEEQMAKARETFKLSCAGYCVATFVLGIGDRHNDNIMLTKDGRLFHIDFGHFLGNFKKKYGIKRERAKFIFTPQYAHVLGGSKSELFQSFEEVCGRAFNILRRKSDLFVTLFQMMLCTGIPELSSEGDIEYLRDAFALGKTDEEAASYFAKLIYASLHTKTTIINDAIHILAHK